MGKKVKKKVLAKRIKLAEALADQKDKDVTFLEKKLREEVVINQDNRMKLKLIKLSMSMNFGIFNQSKRRINHIKNIIK
jgi:membrane-bound ClpP family serine protease